MINRGGFKMLRGGEIGLVELEELSKGRLLAEVSRVVIHDLNSNKKKNVKIYQQVHQQISR